MRIPIAFVVFTFALLHYDACPDYDPIEEFGCHDTQFRFSCQSLTSRIVILTAVFYPRENILKNIGKAACNRRRIRSTDECKSEGLNLQNHNHSIHFDGSNLDLPRGLEFRQAINRRCSGVNYCSFVFEDDYNEARITGLGEVFIRYTCIEGEPYYQNMKKTCNGNVAILREGFVRSPGYPSYYIGETTCQWTLKAFSFQRIKVSFIDLSLRSIGPHESDCTDWIAVSENGLNLEKICGDLSGEIVIYSQSSTLNVTLVANSKTLYPKRGFLLHYKAVGCPSLKKPQDGYLVNRNYSFVHYRCSVGYVFRDTLSRDKILQCYNENTWNGQISDCVSLTKLIQEEINLLPNETTSEDLVAVARAKMEISDPTNDVILPVIIILTLFIGNTILLYIIYRLRKKLAISNTKIAKKQSSLEIKVLDKKNAEELKL